MFRKDRAIHEFASAWYECCYGLWPDSKCAVIWVKLFNNSTARSYGIEGSISEAARGDPSDESCTVDCARLWRAVLRGYDGRHPVRHRALLGEKASQFGLEIGLAEEEFQPDIDGPEWMRAERVNTELDEVLAGTDDRGGL